MLFLYHNLSLLPKSGNPFPFLMSLHPRNTEPSEGTVDLTCNLAKWGWLSPQGGAQPLSSLCADKTLFRRQPPSTALPRTPVSAHSCKCVFPFSGLDCPLTP